MKLNSKSTEGPQELPKERLCFGCRKPFLTVAWWNLCPDCMEEMYENLAVRLDPTYNKAVMNDWSRCAESLFRLYGNLDLFDRLRT